jgi:hypothetical protein
MGSLHIQRGTLKFEERIKIESIEKTALLEQKNLKDSHSNNYLLNNSLYLPASNTV